MPRDLHRSARRRPAVLAVLLGAVLVVTGCGADDDGEASAVPTVTATTAPPESAPDPDAEAAAEPTPDDAEVVAITVSGGEVTGVEPRTEVTLGTRVRLVVTVDAPDELHVHGFDLTEKLSPGQATQLEFVADRPGIFEIELHDTHKVLTRLQVQ
jgi:hypothetical protein